MILDLHFDLTNQLPKFDLYREKIHQINDVSSASANITINAANGPIQRVELTNSSLSSVSLTLQNSSTEPWLSGQGVTVIIENNMFNDTASWTDNNTNRKYNRRPEVLKDRTTIVYIVGYGDSDVAGTMSNATNQRWYITSQTFGALS